MPKKQIDAESILELIENSKWVKAILYGGGVIVGIWVTGKASRLLSDAIINFKILRNAIKS